MKWKSLDNSLIANNKKIIPTDKKNVPTYKKFVPTDKNSVTYRISSYILPCITMHHHAMQDARPLYSMHHHASPCITMHHHAMQDARPLYYISNNIHGNINPTYKVGSLYTFKKFYKLYNINFEIYIPNAIGVLTVIFKKNITDLKKKEKVGQITMSW